MKRREAVAGGTVDALPERLRRCFVEDWIRPGEFAASGTTDGFPLEREMQAHSRWCEARWAWCEENGVDVRALRGRFPGGRPPKWRAVPPSLSS